MRLTSFTPPASRVLMRAQPPASTISIETVISELLAFAHADRGKAQKKAQKILENLNLDHTQQLHRAAITEKGILVIVTKNPRTNELKLYAGSSNNIALQADAVFEEKNNTLRILDDAFDIELVVSPGEPRQSSVNKERLCAYWNPKINMCAGLH